MIYILDTNSFEVVGNYFPGRFPTFWERFEAAVADNTVRSVREVYNEVQERARKEWLRDWARQNRSIFRQPTPKETEFVAEIFRVAHFRQLVGTRQRLRGKPVADPFLIAAAKVQDGCVVTEESFRPNAARIPNVCEHFGIKCTNFEGFLERNDWAF